jgi:hypothetical protein
MYEAAFRRMRRGQKMRYYARRAGCGLLFVFWLALMSLPCLLVNLVVYKEIIIPRGDLPGQETRLFLLDSPDQRGLGLSTSSLKSGGEAAGQYCLITQVSYFMWEGEGEGLSYCNCYENMGGEWAVTLAGGDKNCQALALPNN